MKFIQTQSGYVNLDYIVRFTMSDERQHLNLNEPSTPTLRIYFVNSPEFITRGEEAHHVYQQLIEACGL